jgi:hypothetical protein
MPPITFIFMSPNPYLAGLVSVSLCMLCLDNIVSRDACLGRVFHNHFETQSLLDNNSNCNSVIHVKYVIHPEGRGRLHYRPYYMISLDFLVSYRIYC